MTKTADPLSKVGDAVNYTIEICNAGLFPVDADSVTDTLLGDIGGTFAASLAPGAVLVGDADSHRPGRRP